MSELTLAKAADMTVDIIDNGGADNYTIDELVALLELADHMYYNEDEPFMTDADYDGIRLFASRLAPHHVYFTGVGSEVRGGKVKLPYQMGSLDQVEIGEIADWVGEWSLQDQYMIITDKLDGTSAMVIFDANGDLQIAYSRGNGVEGADITRHIKNFKSVPLNVGKPMVIRGEVIFSYDGFKKVQEKVMSRSGRPYKNARNMTAGLMNAKKNDSYAHLIFNNIRFVAYEILGYDGADKVNMLHDLEEVGFEVPHWQPFKGKELTDSMLAKYLNDRRAKSQYEIDGLVIDVNLAAKREQMNPTRDTLNPAFAVKYKVADASNVAVANVVKVHWAASKHGYLKPRVEIDPVDLVGVTVKHATGFNAQFIHENGIGPGAKIQITRSGDVIPFIQKVIEPATAQMPAVPWYWNDTGVDAILDNHTESEEVIINQMVDFFASIDAPMLRKGNIVKLFDYKQYDTTAIIRLPERMFVSILGENGKKVYAGLRKALINIPLWKLMGSTHFFGRGVGKRKMKKLIDALGSRKVFTGTAAEFARVEGFDEKTARKVEDGMDAFLEWFGPLEDDGYISVDYSTVAEATGSVANMKFCFTGFRNKNLQAVIEAQGGSVMSSVSKNTNYVVTNNPNGTSSKLKKARDLGIPIITEAEMQQMV